MSKKVSVLIPVYNTAPYLKECLDSIVNQTLSDIEIICIDDGSTDNSNAILREYAENNESIVIISQSNKGLSRARNAGLDVATGQYIYFMDSDDKLSSIALNELWQIAHKKEADVVLFSGKAFWDDSISEPQNNAYFETAYQKKASYADVLTGKEMLARLIENKDYSTSVCLQFIRRKFLTDINLRFVPDILHEDNVFTLSMLMQAKRVVCDNSTYFYRRLRAGSIVMQKENYRNLYGYYYSYLASLRLIDDKQLTDYQKEWILRIPTRLLAHVRRIWGECDEENREFFLNSCSQFQRALFITTIKKEIALEQKYKKAEVELEIVKKELQRIKKPFYLRVSETVARIPRRIGGIVKQLR